MEPYLAQGAAMAIEDSAVLAHHLAAGRDDIPAALKAFEAARRPRVAEVWKASKDAGDAYHFGVLAGAARDLALRLAGQSFLFNRNDWLYRWTPPT
jgi:salicylate hydroxylase